MPQYEEYLKKLDHSYNDAKEVFDKKILRLNKNIKDRDNTINDCRNSIKQLEEKFSQLQKDNKNTQSSIREKEGSLTTQKTKIKQLEQKVNNESSVNTNLKNKIIKLEDDLSNEKRKYKEEFLSASELNKEQVNLIKQNHKHKETNNELIKRIQELEYEKTLLNNRIKENDTAPRNSNSEPQLKQTRAIIKLHTAKIEYLKKQNSLRDDAEGWFGFATLIFSLIIVIVFGIPWYWILISLGFYGLTGFIVFEILGIKKDLNGN
jgi:chromosome segregation ATPase